MAGDLANSGFDILPYGETQAKTIFDDGAWRSALLLANPWARRKLLPAPHNWNALAGHATTEAFASARKTACLARWRQGAQAWNLWAAEMLRLRTALERAGLWRAHTRHLVISGEDIARQQGDSACCAAWLALSFADFGGSLLEGHAEFDQLVFPGDLSFRGAVFQSWAGFQQTGFAGPADFSGATFTGDARFRSAHFNGPATFRHTIFNCQAAFHNATFTGAADFRLSKMSGRTSFKRAKFQSTVGFQGAAFGNWAVLRDTQFQGHANFESAVFRAPADFNRSRFDDLALFRHTRFLAWSDFQDGRFQGDTVFQNCRFASWADFQSARFCGWTVFENARFAAAADFHNVSFRQATDFHRADFADSAAFQNAQFKGWIGFVRTLFGRTASFANAQFHHNAEFANARCASGARVELAEAKFQKAPNFHLAQLSEAPKPENIGLPPPRLIEGPWALLCSWLHSEQDQAAPINWRSLKQFAIQTGDAKLEHVFHLRELRSRRGLTDQPLPWFWRDVEGCRRFGWPHGGRFWIGVLQQIGFYIRQLPSNWRQAPPPQSPNVNSTESSPGLLQATGVDGP